MSNSDDGFVDGIIATIILGCAAYGAYKIVQNITMSPEQRLLQNLGRDLKQIDAGLNYSEAVEQVDDDDE